MRAKTQIYMLVVSLIISLLGIAITRHGNSGPTPHASADPARQLRMLEKAAPQSPEMQKFIAREAAAQQANQDAADALPR